METKEYKSFLKTVKGNEGDKCGYPTRLDVYGCGCQHDCKYCVDGDSAYEYWRNNFNHNSDDCCNLRIVN